MRTPKCSKQRIWDRVFGANARDLNLNKTREELSDAEKKAQRTSKATRTKMEAADAAGISSNCVKEILACKGVPLSQSTEYLEGRATDELGNNFCSQDALLMLRNQLEDNSSDDK
jgi:spore maturation protein CgeB